MYTLLPTLLSFPATMTLWFLDCGCGCVRASSLKFYANTLPSSSCVLPPLSQYSININVHILLYSLFLLYFSVFINESNIVAYVCWLLSLCFRRNSIPRRKFNSEFAWFFLTRWKCWYVCIAYAWTYPSKCALN